MKTVDADTGRRRLLLLVEKLRSLPKGRFDYAHWAGDDWAGAKDLSCGTTACALGWATAVPEIAEAGLCLRRAYNNIYVSVEDERLLGPNAGAPYNMSRAAAQLVFGISGEDADFLFIPSERAPEWLGAGGDDYIEAPDEDASAEQVADHIEQFVALKWPVPR